MLGHDKEVASTLKARKRVHGGRSKIVSGEALELSFAAPGSQGQRHSVVGGFSSVPSEAVH